MSLMPQRFPGWKKIGWHVGKKLHDIFNPPSQSEGPSKEERRAQRLEDALKGFAYFDAFEDVKQWTVSSVDPLQRANIPICLRPPPAEPGGSAPSKQAKRTVTILCHDFKGGYVDSEALRPSPRQNAIYSCEYLQSVDAFIYFSHHLVTIPPPPWTNCLHTNGVRSLGTFIIEPQTIGTEQMLDFRDGGYVLVQKLAAMAEAFGFDGWLLNLEREFIEDSTREVVNFVEDLKSALGPERLVLWYDALSIHNKVDHQNGLTHENTRFAQKADGLFTNYKWDLEKLEQSRSFANRCGVPFENLFFGIDVWAQNNPMSGPPRITFPKKGGGGTNTGYAMRTLADTSVSTAVFAPGWTHEHFSCELNGLEAVSDRVSRSLWEGTALPELLDCDCRGRPHHSSQYQSYPILESAIEYPAGTYEYFSTDFSSAFGACSSEPTGAPQILPCLGLQSISPRKSKAKLVEAASSLLADGVYVKLSRNEKKIKRSLSVKISNTSVVERRAKTKAGERKHLELYKLALECKQKLSLTTSYSVCESLRLDEGCSSGLYISILTQSGPIRNHYVPLGLEQSTMSTLSYEIRGLSAISKIIALGFYSEGQSGENLVELFQCHSLSIVPSMALVSASRSMFSILDLNVKWTTINGKEEGRLQWDWSGDRAAWPSCFPWSQVTGPFSHFVVRRDLIEIGISQSTEFPLNPTELMPVSREKANGIEFSVEAFCFAGIDLDEPAVATLVYYSPGEGAAT